MKPIGAHSAIANGIPQDEKPFLKQMSLDKLYSLYISLTATPSRVLDLMEEPDFLNCTEEWVFGYLREFIGNLSVNKTHIYLLEMCNCELCAFLFPPQGYVQQCFGVGKTSNCAYL